MAVLDVEIYDLKSDPPPQAKYLVHGHDDIYWTNNIEDVLYFLRVSLEEIERRQKLTKKLVLPVRRSDR